MSNQTKRLDLLLQRLCRLKIFDKFLNRLVVELVTIMINLDLHRALRNPEFDRLVGLILFGDFDTFSEFLTYFRGSYNFRGFRHFLEPLLSLLFLRRRVCSKKFH